MMTPSSTYYPALTQSNVTLITDPIDHITSTGIMTSTGTEVEADLILMATGFKVVSLSSNLAVYGVGGKLQETVFDGIPKAYRGFCLPNVPNYFHLIGPNSGFSHTSVVFTAESQMVGIVKMLKESLVLGLEKIQVRDDAVNEYTNWIHKGMDKTVLSFVNGSWFHSKGRNVTMWPYSGLYQWWVFTSRPDWREFLSKEEIALDKLENVKQNDLLIHCTNK
jgi:4-hydroxyacetophenone monooxygenase